MDLGAEFKQIRKSLKMTQGQLAETLNIDQGYVSAIENGKKPITEMVVDSLERSFPDISISHIKSFITNGERGGKEQLLRENKSEYHYNSKQRGIPMYDVPASASNIEIYNDLNDDISVGYMYFPGIEDCDFALPVWGHSMYPYMENGCWAACKSINDPTKIVFGEVYYIEWGDYRMFKRLLAGDQEGEVIAHSDNIGEMIGNRPKYAQFVIQKKEIRKLCLVKDIHKKHNH